MNAIENPKFKDKQINKKHCHICKVIDVTGEVSGYQPVTGSQCELLLHRGHTCSAVTDCDCYTDWSYLTTKIKHNVLLNT